MPLPRLSVRRIVRRAVQSVLREAARPSHAHCVVEPVEGRQLFAHAFGSLSNGVLTINGTAGNDVMTTGVKNGRLRVVLNGVLSQWTATDVSEIDSYMGDGNDSVDYRGVAIRTYAIGELGNDTLYGGAGNDSLTGAAGKDVLVGGDGNDRLSGGKSNDVVEGDAGDDVLYGNEGDDKVNGNDGNDHLFGEAGLDTMSGDAGKDALYGGDDADKLFGMAGNDLIDGGDGSDRLYGGDGNDNITGGTGRDWMYGEAGNDTMTSVDGSTDRVVDGGDGTNAITVDASEKSIVTGGTTISIGTPTTTPTDPTTPTTPADPTSPTDPTTPVVPAGAHTKGLGFADEALWDANFSDAVAKVKSAGVNTVRVWCETGSYDERPNAYDTENDANIVKNWDSTTPDDERAVTAGLAMKRAIQLHAMGFHVILTVSVHGGDTPTGAQQVKDFYQHLASGTLNADGTGGTVKDAVDAWEVGQEVDLGKNWAPTKNSGKAAGLKAYVNQLLIPAASVLHAGTDQSKWSKVCTASVSFDANDVKAIINEVQAQNALGDVDYIGFHPYGDFTSDGKTDNISSRVNALVTVSKQVKKPLIATEWNLRNFKVDGTQDTQWAAAVGAAYKKVIAPNFAYAAYFTAVDDYKGRGGTVGVTARPGGIFIHDSSADDVTPQSDVDDLIAYYKSPLIDHGAFYDVYKDLV